METSRRPGYEAAQQGDWHPIATYTLLGVIGAFFLVQNLVLMTRGQEMHNLIFTINIDWPTRPWTLITATLSHGGLWHILINGLVLFFFGPTLERLIGRTQYVVLFFVAGAVASILQVALSHYLFNVDLPGLGASGAIMMIFGALMIVMPNEKVLIWGIIPLPFWAAGIGFAFIDVIGALDPYGGVGNFAHLSGMAIGFWVGWTIRQRMKAQGLRLVSR